MSFSFSSPGHLSFLSSPHESEPLCGPGPDRELVLLLIKATDAISLEWVAQTGLPLGNQFAMADARRGKTCMLHNSCSPVNIEDLSLLSS